MERVEALSLVDWLEEELRHQPPGLDPMALKEIIALCKKLRAAPGSPEPIAEQTTAVEAWSRVLLSPREHWRYDRPGHPGHEEVRRRALLATRMLRDLIQHARTEAAPSAPA